MASPFSIFDRNVTLSVSGGQTGGTYNDNDVWVPGTTTGPTVIRGHMSAPYRDMNESGWRSSPVGPIEVGDYRLFTDVAIAKGSILTADQDAPIPGIPFQYRVLGLIGAKRFMHKMLGGAVRHEYHLKEIPR